MIRRPLASALLAATTAGTLLMGSGSLAQAAEPTAEPSAPTAQEPTAEPTPDPVNPVIANYDGRKINLAESWEGANICSELPDGEVHCYDTNEESLADPALPAKVREETLKATKLRAADPRDNCAADYWCLYQDANYKGRRLQFSSSGKKDLGDYGFRDKLSSVYYWVGRWSLNYGTATIWDSRSWPLHDRERELVPPHGWANFKNMDYPGGGNWDNKVDVFQVKRN
ncbi:peptidase inhibitor family I36 protein [Streptomyces sp. HD]|uniref:peptidase inhibitor family I36 protein n=1 Tax=Streptomyces sp. HD TaxID=3020892 RepID=UPI00232DDAFD|nr:peptidase inhibitor family I36 protein [Streptomyces sp. HD]MDC0766089.1 peptidase inhibitor family I36 protein [Streptomyces sp. HD]